MRRKKVSKVLQNALHPRVIVATRIHDPEPSAASFRLEAVENGLQDLGYNVTVLTTKYPDVLVPKPDLANVKRWPVLRDKTGYVRGYLPYLSFDIPLFFRLLCEKRPDVVLVEPPPTTGAVIRAAAFIRGFPYVWYAADIWSDASQIAGAPAPVVAALRFVEKFAIKGAAGVIAVSDGVASRVRELGGENVAVVPNGIDTSVYRPDVRPLDDHELDELGVTGTYFLYAGTASEWQGASVFAQAFDEVAKADATAQVVFVGQGSEWDKIGDIANRLKWKYGRDVVIQVPQSSPDFVARLLAGAKCSLVSIVPDKGYDFAYPTKVLAGLSAGVRVLYAGKGPVVQDVVGNDLGRVVDHDAHKIAQGIIEELNRPAESSTPKRLRNWVIENRSMKATGQNAAQFVTSVTGASQIAPEPPQTISVAVVTPWYPTSKNPVSGLFVKREVDALQQAGVDVRVVHLDRELPDGLEQREIREGLRILHIGMNPANPVSVARAVGPLRAALANVDVVNSHAISALPAVAAARGNRRWVHTEHWSALSSPTSAAMLLRAVRPAFATLLRLPDVVVAESERLAEPIRKFRGERPVALVPCIVPAPAKLDPLKMGEGALRLASTGGVIERKNPLLAVETLLALKHLGVDASLRWTGDGNQREEAIALAKELEVDAVFLGSGTPKQVEEEISKADIFFAPTKGENFFVAAAESLVNGRPLCASDQGGHVEYADPRFSEIVVEQSPEAYAKALLRLRDKTREVTAEEISASVKERFSPATVAQMYLDIYVGLLKK